MRIYKISSIEDMATLTGLSVADVNKGIEYGSFRQCLNILLS